MLRNPVYMGTYWYQRTQVALPQRRAPGAPAYRQRLKTSARPRPETDWIAIPVPALVSEARWQAAQRQLAANSRYARRNNTRHQYLLRGLVKCVSCGGSYIGFTDRGRRGYRCARNHPVVSSTGQHCRARRLPGDPLETVVWSLVTEALQQPELLLAEYDRQQQEQRTAAPSPQQRSARSVKRLERQEARLTEAYLAEALELPQFQAAMQRLRAERQALEQEQAEAAAEADRQHQQAVTRAGIAAFCAQVSAGLAALTFDERQQLLRLLVERVTVSDDLVQVQTIIPSAPVSSPPATSLHVLRGEPVEPPPAWPNVVAGGPSTSSGRTGRRCRATRPRDSSTALAA